MPEARGQGDAGRNRDFGTIFAIGLAFIASVRPEWLSNTHTLGVVNAIGGWMVPIGLLASITVVRLILAPYWLYHEAAVKLQAVNAKRPAIVCLTSESIVEPKVTHDQHGNIIVRVAINLRFDNVGDGSACNYKIAIYSCWLKEPDNIDKWADDFCATWAPHERVDYPFAQQRRAEPIGGGQVGITSLDEIVFRVEIEARANTPDGPEYRQALWLCWALDHPLRPPNPAMVESLRLRFDTFKALPI